MMMMSSVIIVPLVCIRLLDDVGAFSCVHLVIIKRQNGAHASKTYANL